MAKEGDVFQVFTNTMTIKVAGAENRRALAMFVDEAPPNTGVPMHIHRDQEETVFVLKGRYKISVGGQIREVRTGDGAYLPANVPHAYKNIGDDVGQLLFTIWPSGLEDLFEEISKSDLQIADGLSAVNRISTKHQTEFIGPPLD